MAELLRVLAEVSEDIARFKLLLLVISGALAVASAIAVEEVIKANHGSFQWARDWMREPRSTARYRGLVGYGSSVAGRFYLNPRGVSPRGFTACALVVCIAPAAMWQLALALAKPIDAAGGNAVDDVLSTPTRWLGLLVFWGLMLCVCILMANRDRIASCVLRSLVNGLHRAGLRQVVPTTPPRTGVSVLALFAVFTALLGLGTGVGIIAAVAAFVVFADVAVAAGISAFAEVTDVTIAAVVVGVGSVAAIFLTIGLLRPVTHRWNATYQRPKMARPTILELIAAVATLATIAILLPAVLQIANRGLAVIGWPVVEWAHYLEAARTDPFGAGLFVTGMLATALIPTVIRLLATGVTLALPTIGGSRIASHAATVVGPRIVIVFSAVLSVVISWATIAILTIVTWNVVRVFLGPPTGGLGHLAIAVGRVIGGPGSPN